MEETVSDAPSKIQPISLAGPSGSASRVKMGTVSAMTITSPSQNEEARDFSIRVCARAMRFGNKSHHTVSMAGKAMPRISRIKKMAEMSAIGKSFHLVDIKDTGID